MKCAATARCGCARSAEPRWRSSFWASSSWLEAERTCSRTGILGLAADGGSETVRKGKSDHGEREEGKEGRGAGGAESSPGGASQRQGDAAAEDALPEGSGANLDEGIRTQEPHGGSAPPQDRGQHGGGRSHTECEGPRSGGERVGPDHGAETGGDTGQEVDRGLQGARGTGDRGDGDPARRPHVRVLRSAGEYRAPAGTRLPRGFDQVVRRAWQLHPGLARPADFPRDRLRQGGQ